MPDNDHRPITQEEYRDGVFLLMGQHLGIMSRLEDGADLGPVKDDLWDNARDMLELYRRSKRSGL